MTKAVILDLRTIRRDDIDCLPKVIITPDIAGEILAKHNTLNRPVKDAKAQEFADDMKHGKWTLDGEPIIFSKEGILLDGQHRLYASWLYAKKSFETTVTLGVDKENFKNIDTGTKRSGGDVLFIDGKLSGESTKYRTTLWSAAKICIEYQRGVIKQKGAKGSVTSADHLDFIHKNPDLFKWIERIKAEKNDMTGSYTAPLAAVCFLANNKFPMKAESFMHGVVTGENLSAGSPILALRRALKDTKRLDRWERIYLVIHAYNLHVENKTRDFLRLPKGEVPFIIGNEPKWLKKDEKAKPTKKRVNLKPKHIKGINGIKDKEAREMSYIQTGKVN